MVLVFIGILLYGCVIDRIPFKDFTAADLGRGLNHEQQQLHTYAGISHQKMKVGPK